MTLSKAESFTDAAFCVADYLTPSDFRAIARADAKTCLAMLRYESEKSFELMMDRDIGQPLCLHGMDEAFSKTQCLAAHYFGFKNGLTNVSAQPEIQELKDIAFMIHEFSQDVALDLSRYRGLIEDKETLNLLLMIDPVKTARILPDQLPFILDCMQRANHQAHEIAAFLTGDLSDHPSVANCLLETAPCGFQHLSSRFRADAALSVQFIKKNGLLLEFVSDELKDFPELVLEAVKKNGNALAFASMRLRSDRFIVAQALRSHPMALRHAAPDFEIDDELLDMHLAHRSF